MISVALSILSLLASCLGWFALVIIAIVVLVWVIFFVIPAAWSAACYAGFAAFADAEEKREARKLGREMAQFEHRLKHESTPEPARAPGSFE